MKRAQTLAIITAAGLSSSALADHVLQIDTNALSAEADSAFSDTYTGDFRVFNTASTPDTDGDAEILDVLINGAAQGTGGATASEFYFEMNIEFSAGKIVSGDVTVKVDQSGSENTYTAALAPTASVAIQDVGGLGIIFNIGGLTFAGAFASPTGTFLGVDISPWGNAQPVPGRFSEIAFIPDSSNNDSDTDVDVFIIPLPSGAALASIGLMGMLARRRR